MCGSKHYGSPGDHTKMPCAAYTKKVLIHRLLPIFVAMMLSCACSFGQADAKPKPGGSESKKASAGKGKKQTGAASPEKKTEAEQAGPHTPPAPTQRAQQPP